MPYIRFGAMAYESTNVTVEKSQGEIRKLLGKHGASRFAFGEERDEGQRWAGVSFTHESHSVRLRVPLRPVSEREVGAKYQRSRSKGRDEIRDQLYEQEEKRIWRVIAWNLKARLVAVEEGVETFEEAFLAHLVNHDTGRTVYQELAHSGRIELPAPLPALGAGDLAQS